MSHPSVPSLPFDADAFLSATSLSLGTAPGERRSLYERLATLLWDALPEALVLVDSFDEQDSALHHRAWAGPPGSEDAAAALMEGPDAAPCPDPLRARLLEPRLRAEPGGLSPQASAWDAPGRYELGLAYDGALLGAVTLLHPRPLSPAEQRWVEALAQHASIALARERADVVDETALLVGLDGSVQACSRQTVERLGPTPEGTLPPEAKPEDQLARRRDWAKALLGRGRAVRYTEHNEGRIRDCSLHPVLGEDGRVHAFAGFARDITEQVRLQERIEQAATFQRALFSSLGEGVMVLDEQGVITDCNRAMEQALGMERRVLIGRWASSLCAQRASWEHWEQELLPQLEPGGAPVQHQLRLRREDGGSFTARVGASRIVLPGARGGVVWIVRDVTDELLRYEQLEHMATHDALTGLPNRLLFHDRLGRAQQASQRYGTSFAVLMVDLDGFKAINDSLGHETGDQLLAALGARLQGALRAADTVSRLGGDEFAVLLPTSISADHALRVGAKLLGAIEQPFSIDGRELQVSASIGVARFPEHHSPQQDLLACADQTMYAAKRQGGHRVLMADDGSEG
jgi:diguanylate cyclase (GGDEF)-like protein/PAS domain S-box-containing protein